MKRFTYPLFILLITLVMAEVTLRVLTKRRQHIDYLFGKKSYFLPPFYIPEKIAEADTTHWFKYNVYDENLGWSIGKLGAQPPYYSDHNGFRCSQQLYETLRNGEPSRPELNEVYDIVCLGNSFTHGDEVSFEDTWPYRLQQLTGLRTLNLGVGGYGIDQAFLRYEQEKPQAKLVILGMVAGDLDRACSQVYNLTVGGLKTKPMFELSNGWAEVRNRPSLHGEKLKNEFENPATSEFLMRERLWPGLFVRDVFDNFYLIRTIRAFPIWSRHRQSVYRTDGPELAYSVAIIKYAQQQVAKQDARFVVLLLDNLNTFLDWDRYGNPWLRFTSELEKQGIEYWYYDDLLYQQYKSTPEAVINKGLVHYTPQSNQQVAEFLKSQILNRADETKN